MDAIRIGQVKDRIIVGISNRTILDISENQCICQMTNLNGPIVALNYFQTNRTCQLFIFNNSSLVIQYYSNSSFRFINQSAISITTIQPNVICNPNCQNNGTCNASGLCSCPASWSGTQCEIPVCSTPCQNSGNCTAPNVCTCYNGWTGTYCQTVRTILWSFDNTLNDVSGQFTGVRSNSPAYTTGINGYGSALVFNGNIGQCVIVSPYLSMSNMSFTWEFWIYPTVIPTGNSVFIGQCSQSTTGQCLLLMTRNNTMRFSFGNNDTVGSSLIPANKWSHLAFVYDAASNNKFIYLNGVIEATQNSTGPLQVSATNMTFGCRATDNGSSYEYPYTGYIDQMLYNSRIKNASEILDDATLVVYYRFLATAPLLDSGPNYINGSRGGGAVSISSGIANQAINFTVSGSYFQFTGLTLLATSNWPFSLSVWFKTNALNGGGTIAHISASTSGTGYCFRLIGLTSNGSIEVQIYNGNNIVLTGPVMSIGVWNHAVYTFSPSNGIRLYVNGSLSRSLLTSYTVNNPSVTLTLGNPLSGTSCGSSLPNQQFYGSVDEVRLYSRQLVAGEISQLYSNP